VAGEGVARGGCAGDAKLACEPDMPLQAASAYGDNHTTNLTPACVQDFCYGVAAVEVLHQLAVDFPIGGAVGPVFDRHAHSLEAVAYLVGQRPLFDVAELAAHVERQFDVRGN